MFQHAQSPFAFKTHIAGLQDEVDGDEVDGELVGESDGYVVGLGVGRTVGAKLGAAVGTDDGIAVGDFDGDLVGGELQRPQAGWSHSSQQSQHTLPLPFIIGAVPPGQG